MREATKAAVIAVCTLDNWVFGPVDNHVMPYLPDKIEALYSLGRWHVLQWHAIQADRQHIAIGCF